MYEIRKDDLSGDATRALLALHLAGMHDTSPPGIRPPIWRRLEVPSRLGVGRLHDAIQGYRDLLAALANPSRREARERSEWMELDFDPEQFSVEIVDARIGAQLKSQAA
jgi:hypothetical protein